MRATPIVAIAVSFAAPATAQQLAVAPLAPSNAAVLRTGTQVHLTMEEGLTTEGKKLRVGQRFQLQVAEPVSVSGQVVIPAGSPAVGEVTEVRNKGMWGKSGRINARVLYATVNGRQIRLSGQLDDKGVTGTAGVVGSVVLIPVAGFFMTGTSARIPVGSPVTAFVDEDVPLAFSATAPAPLVVPTAAAAAAAAAAAPAPVEGAASAH